MPFSTGHTDQGANTTEYHDVQTVLATDQTLEAEQRASERRTFGRLLTKLGGLAILGIFFTSLYGILHLDPAKEALEDTKVAVAEHLKDSASAKYRNLKVYRLNTGKMLVCGEANARNSFGALAGYTRFIGPARAVALVETDLADKASFDNLWVSLGCTGSHGDLIMAL